MIIEFVPTIIVKHQWFRGRIVACHAIDPGSVPARWNLLSAHDKCAYYYQRIAAKNAHAEKRARRQNRARRGKCARKEKYMIREDVHTSTFKHRWFSGKIVACHAIDTDSIDPADANYYLHIKAFLQPIPTFRDQLS